MANEYGDHSDVEPYFKQLTLSATTLVSDAEVNTFMDQFARWVDIKISTRYTVPITDTDGIKVLTMICAMKTAAKVKRILNADNIENSKTKKTEADILDEQADKMIEDIASGKIEFFEAAKSFSFIAASYNQKNDISPIFEKELDQW